MKLNIKNIFPDEETKGFKPSPGYVITLRDLLSESYVGENEPRLIGIIWDHLHNDYNEEFPVGTKIVIEIVE